MRLYNECLRQMKELQFVPNMSTQHPRTLSPPTITKSKKVGSVGHRFAILCPRIDDSRVKVVGSLSPNLTVRV